MSNERRFEICDVCGNFVEVIEEGVGGLSCCGQPMNRLTANSTDGAKEKHVPQVKLEGNKLCVEVGESLHPMTDKHLIKWIFVAQEGKTQRITLSPSSEPKGEFYMEDTKTPITVYEYCNIHGLWKKDV